MPLTSTYAVRGAVPGRRRPLYVRAHRAWSTDGDGKSHGRAGGSGYADRPRGFVPLTWRFRISACHRHLLIAGLGTGLSVLGAERVGLSACSRGPNSISSDAGRRTSRQRSGKRGREIRCLAMAWAMWKATKVLSEFQRTSEVTASAPRLPIRLDHGCAAKTWATAPPLKAVVLTGSMVSGARKIRSPASTTAGWMRRRYSSIKPVSTSDRANRAPPWASRYPSECSCLSRVMASARSPAAIVASPQPADASESDKACYTSTNQVTVCPWP